MKKQKLFVLMLIVLVLVSVFAISCKQPGSSSTDEGKKKEEVPKDYATIEIEGADPVQVEIKDGKITLPASAKKTGYDFVKWTVDGKDVQGGQTIEYIKGTTVITAEFTIKRLDVRFYSGIEGEDDDPFPEITVDYGSKIADPVTDPSYFTLGAKLGKEFDYWEAEDHTKFNFDTDTITTDTYLTAVWKYRNYTVKKTVGPAGGLIIYDAGSEQTLTYTDKDGNTVTKTWRFLELALGANVGSYVWSTGGNDCETGKEIGDGFVNTYDLALLGCPAAVAAVDYSVTNDYGTFKDWFIPSLEEAKKIGDLLLNDGWGNRYGNGNEGFYYGKYWTSSESDVNFASTMDLTQITGSTYLAVDYSDDSAKTESNYVRVIRMF